ncbi:hypothetical protein AB1A81_01165 [Bdellovibrio bacteriovorus]|uniref:Uncharacterized protein n=1 Tax=Bdellovibrio bacteriovorus (strain ATCC 15356 / DSM 50701 / NCIMB 9529 / HD100) TaxID=264462 RepID=Q6MR48_BDEBA|nr:hypothetical protein [Bdellovibrio bacteriovorus]CAE77910.1 hypothetical protein predicted by Glimmer/Critica [Bdellovibrio bacteriovorus HD100]
MNLLLCFLMAVASWPSLVLATSPYSPSEGVVEKGHDPALNKYRQRFFYNPDGTLSAQKLESLVRFLDFQKSLLMDSAKMNRKANLILVHGYENDKAEKEGLEAQSSESETIAPLIFALEHARDLQARHTRMSRNEVHEKAELILLFLAAGYTPYPMTIFTSLVERVKNLAENFFEFSVNDSGKTQASNLLLNGRFATQNELRLHRQSGNDLSKLDPPSSAIWTDNDIESYDPYLEIYWGRKFFPPREDPVPVFHYERLGNGTIKFKTHWFDSQELNKKGLPKKKDVTLRVGFEAYNASVVNHLARIIGYPANPTTFRSAIKLELGETDFEEFLTQWRNLHGLEMGSAMTHVDRIPGENAVILKNVTLEAYPDKDDYRRMGPFRMGDNGLRNRREYRAMVLYNALISLQDQFEYQSRVDAVRDSKRGWLPLFFLSDTSSALGLPAMLGNVGAVNEFTWEFTKKSDGQVRLFWFSVFNSRTWKDTTYSDVKWLARRMARIRTDQIDGIMETSGFPEPVRRLYAEKLKSRLNKMMVDFDLSQEGFAAHPVRSRQELSAAYPDYINEKGFLKEGAQEYPGNTLPILGNRFTPLQGALVLTLNALHNKFLTLFNPANYGKGDFVVDLGNTTIEGGIGIEASRGVSVNPELGPGQRRYLLNDKVSISIPVGMFSDRVTTPLALYYTYTFEYLHSVSTMKEVGTSRFFALLNPFSILEIRRSLGVGEQLRVTHSFGASVGKTKLKVIDDVQIEAALIGLGYASIKTVYYSKPHPTLVEISTDHVDTASISSGIDVRTYLRVAASMRAQRSKKVYRMYRVDLLNESLESQAHLQDAVDAALVDSDFTALTRLVKPHEWIESAKSKHFNLAFMVWKRSSDSGVSDLSVNGQKLVLAHKSKSYDRSLSRLWDEKLDIGFAKPAVNVVGEFWGEGMQVGTTIEGVVDSQQRRFSEIEVMITLSIFDNYCTRKEFEKTFKKFFNKRAGMDNYIRFQMPDELEAYPELVGTMRWQISKKALRDILSAASNVNNLDYLLPSGGAFHQRNEGSTNDPRDDVSRRAQKLLRALDKEVTTFGKLYTLEAQAKDLLSVLEDLTGRKGETVAQLRKFTRDENIWLTTNIANMLELSHPTFRQQKNGEFWAREIGKYQGHSYLDRFRRTKLLQPVY